MGPQIIGNDGKDNAVPGYYDDNQNFVVTGEPVMIYWININRTPVVAELVALAAERSGSKVEYRDAPGSYDDMDLCDAAEAYDNGYRPENLIATMGSLWMSDYRDKTAFWAELRRLEALVKKPLEEPILHDDYPLHQGFFYVANGKVRQFIDGERMTVGRWKALRIPDVEVITEVRQCDMAGRRLRAPEKKAPESSLSRALTSNGQRLSQHQKYRRPRNSRKIKKVK